MSGKRVLWRDRCDERVRDRRRRQGRVMAALAQGGADAEAAADTDAEPVEPAVYLHSWLMLKPAAEGLPGTEPPGLDP